MINAIQSTSISEQITYTKDKTTNTEQLSVSATYETGVIVDIGNDTGKSATYSKPTGTVKISTEEINKLWEQANKATESLRSLVDKLIHRQGKKTEDLKSGKDVLIVDDETQAEAQKMISDDGEWGVKAVSQRIVDFAKAISGGDKTKLDELKGAIEQGFKEAEKAFGGELPEISKQTHEEIMKQLDAWNQEETPQE